MSTSQGSDVETKLYAPPEYLALTADQRADICNGCGTKGLCGIVVPDTFYGLSIKLACDIHDFMYAVGKTIEDKIQADFTFLNNMLRIIEAETRFYIVKALRRRRALKYYEAVRDFGGPAFWSGKAA